MNLRKRSARFFLSFLVIFMGMLAAWSVVGPGYGALFRAAGGAMTFASGPWEVKYSRQLDGDAPHDTRVLLRNRKDSLQRDVNLSSRRMAYMPTVFLFALVLATPVPWIRKRVAILWSMVGIHLYIAARLAIVPSTYIAERGKGEQETVFTLLEWILSASYAGWAIVPLIIWVIVTLQCSLPLTSHGFPSPDSDNIPA